MAPATRRKWPRGDRSRFLDREVVYPTAGDTTSDLVHEPELATSTSFCHHQHHSTKYTHSHNSNSSILLADDEDDEAGSPDEVDKAPRVIAHPKDGKQCSSQTKVLLWLRWWQVRSMSLNVTKRNTVCVCINLLQAEQINVSVRVPPKLPLPEIELVTQIQCKLLNKRCYLSQIEAKEGQVGALALIQALQMEASKEPQGDTCNRSLIEVEQILPSTEHIMDPRDFYTSDSPVLDGNFDSDQGLYESAEEFPESIDPGVQSDHQVDSGPRPAPMVPSCWVPEYRMWPAGNSNYRHQFVQPDCGELWLYPGGWGQQQSKDTKTEPTVSWGKRKCTGRQFKSLLLGCISALTTSELEIGLG
ncbi:hypothetical protein EDB89DRAFT_1906340 [Lactarius sanguifluus]|nr:hypothetical protein EDB89DRAFT_1906340 [Lactarius sanguifluus]